MGVVGVFPRVGVAAKGVLMVTVTGVYLLMILSGNEHSELLPFTARSYSRYCDYPLESIL